jgi:hypothetical protein
MNVDLGYRTLRCPRDLDFEARHQFIVAARAATRLRSDNVEVGYKKPRRESGHIRTNTRPTIASLAIVPHTLESVESLRLSPIIQ